jgi:hypothetical protein
VLNLQWHLELSIGMLCAGSSTRFASVRILRKNGDHPQPLTPLGTPIMKLLTAFLPGLLACLIETETLSAADEEFIAIDRQRQTIYHSPQTPGYTCWVGTWTMPDGQFPTET